MQSEKLVEVMKKLEEGGITLEKAGEEIKVPADLIRLYAIGGPVPDRIVTKLEKLLQAE